MILRLFKMQGCMKISISDLYRIIDTPSRSVRNIEKKLGFEAFFENFKSNGRNASSMSQSFLKGKHQSRESSTQVSRELSFNLDLIFNLRMPNGTLYSG